MTHDVDILRVKILRCGLVVARNDSLTVTFYVRGGVYHQRRYATYRLRLLGYTPIKTWRNWVNQEADFRRGESYEQAAA